MKLDQKLVDRLAELVQGATAKCGPNPDMQDLLERIEAEARRENIRLDQEIDPPSEARASSKEPRH